MLREPYTTTSRSFETLEWYRRVGRLALVRVLSPYAAPRWCIMHAALYPSGDVAFWHELGSYLYKGVAARKFNRLSA